MKVIADHLKDAWSVCPRLYYLNDIDILPLLSENTNANKLMPTISKVFPITSVKQLDIISHIDDKAEEGNYNNNALYKYKLLILFKAFR